MLQAIYIAPAKGSLHTKLVYTLNNTKGLIQQHKLLRPQIFNKFDINDYSLTVGMDNVEG